MKHRRILMGGALGMALAVAAPVVMAQGATAVDDATNKYVQLEVVNNTDEELDVGFGKNEDKKRGRTASADRGGMAALPGATVPVGAKGGTTPTYSVDFVGTLDWNQAMGYIYDHENYFNVQATNKNGTQTAQVTLSHEGREYGQAAQKALPMTMSQGVEEAYGVKLVDAGNPANGFAKKYRLVIERDQAWQTKPVNPTVAGRQGFVAGADAWYGGMTDRKCQDHIPAPGDPSPLQCREVTLTPNIEYKLTCSRYDGMSGQVTVNGIRYDSSAFTTGEIYSKTDSRGKFAFQADPNFKIECQSWARFMSEVDAKRLTGPVAAKPVYKVTMPQFQRSFDKLPTEVPVTAYTVSGKDAGGSWREVGKLVPVGKPDVDRDKKLITYQEASFFFENTDGAPQYTELKVSDGSSIDRTVNLATVPGPPADLSQTPITSITSAAATGLPVPGNGAAQEALKLKLTASGEVVNPDDRPDLARLYDYLYFRDSTGALVTGLYKSPADGGYTAVSGHRGAYVNELQTMQAGSDPQRFYLSTTAKTSPRIVAHLEVTKVQKQPGETTVTRSDPTATAQGSARSGISLSQGAADPKQGAFHHNNGEKAEATLLNRYEVHPALTSLPAKPAYTGQFVVENGGTSLHLNTIEHLNGTTNVDSYGVNSKGTYVTMNGLKA